jgi:hypothetical protein
MFKLKVVFIFQHLIVNGYKKIIFNVDIFINVEVVFLIFSFLLLFNLK